jgi:hypothetical protein
MQLSVIKLIGSAGDYKALQILKGELQEIEGGDRLWGAKASGETQEGIEAVALRVRSF